MSNIRDGAAQSKVDENQIRSAHRRVRTNERAEGAATERPCSENSHRFQTRERISDIHSTIQLELTRTHIPTYVRSAAGCGGREARAGGRTNERTIVLSYIESWPCSDCLESHNGSHTTRPLSQCSDASLLSIYTRTHTRTRGRARTYRRLLIQALLRSHVQGSRILSNLERIYKMHVPYVTILAKLGIPVCNRYTTHSLSNARLIAIVCQKTTLVLLCVI